MSSKSKKSAVNVAAVNEKLEAAKVATGPAPSGVLVVGPTWWGKGDTIAAALAAARAARPELTSKGQRTYEAWSTADPLAEVTDGGVIKSAAALAPVREVKHGKDVTDLDAMVARLPKATPAPRPAAPKDPVTCSSCKTERHPSAGSVRDGGAWVCDVCHTWAGVGDEPDPEGAEGVRFTQGLKLREGLAPERTWIARRGDAKASGATKAEALRALPAPVKAWGRSEGRAVDEKKPKDRKERSTKALTVNEAAVVADVKAMGAGQPTYRALAEKYGVKKEKIRDIAKRGGIDTSAAARAAERKGKGGAK